MDNNKLDSFGIVIASFLVKKKKNSCLFKTTFILADLVMNIALRIFFFTLSNIRINFIN